MASEPALARSLAEAPAGKTGLVRAPAYSAAPLAATDWAMAALIAAAAACIALWNHAQIDPAIYKTFNIFFQADPPRVISNLTERWSPFQNRNVAHPLFSILGLAAVKGAGAAGIEPMRAIAALLAGAAAVSAGGFFLALRGLAMPRLPALGFAAAYVSGAAFLHWTAFPETYAASGATIAVMIAVLACAPRTATGLWTLASAGTLAMLITNWSMGLAAAAMRLPWRRFLLVTCGALALVSAGSWVQHKTLHRARFFLDPVGIEREHTFSGPQMRRLGMRWDAMTSLRDGVVTPAVAPLPEVVTEPTEAGPFTMVTNQFVPLARLGIGGGVALLAWLALLAGGAAAAVTVPRLRAIGLALGAFLVFQLAFHSVYGEITFLYAADMLPAMTALAALGWFAPWRRLTVAALLLFVGFGAVTNETRFLEAAAMAHDVAVAKTQGRAFGR